MDKTTGKHGEPQKCTQCKKSDVLITERFKRCSLCREKAKIRSKKKAEEKTKLLGSFSVSKDRNLDKFAKRSAKTNSELEGGAHKRAQKGNQGSLDAVVQASETLAGSIARSEVLEYQEASLLYAAAKVASSTTPLGSFSGRHSIVRCENIDNARRAKLVTNDLRKLVKLSFKHSQPLSRVHEANIVQTVYNCTCKSVTKGLVNLLDRRLAGASSLTKALNSTGPKENIGPTEIPCGGFITVTVQDDVSPLSGIPGQEIIIQVSH